MVVVSMMVMYEDDSVEVRCGDGSCLQLAPCGSEFFLEKTVPPSAHPLQLSEKVRQRTRFVTSTHKDLIIQALEFRNRFAVRPYIPQELIPSDSRMHYLTDISEIEWPPPSSCGLEFGSNGETIVSSVDGNASLLLSSSKEEFLVEFLCRTSRTEARTTVGQDSENNAVLKHGQSQDTSTADLQCSQQTNAGPAMAKESGPKSPKVLPRKEHLYTRVVQQHSCACVPPIWEYPLSLALGLCDSEQRKPSEHTVEDGAGTAEGAPVHSLSRGKRGRLPESLPLICPAPHQHRWNFRDLAQRSEPDLEQGLRTELIKVLWRQGIVYRLISGPITIVEISPGDGSVIRSDGAVGNYFTHYTSRLAFGQNEEKRYYVNSLPPDVPGQPYSVSSVVTRANSILRCYSQARLSLKLPNSFCCWRQEAGSSHSLALILESHVPGSGHFMAFSGGRVHVIFLDGVTLQMMWNFDTSTPAPGAEGSSQPPRRPQQPCGWCQLVLPDEQRLLLQLQAPGAYSRYVSAAVQWSRWVEDTVANGRAVSCEVQHMEVGQSWSVVAELEKIKRFNFLLDHSGLLKAQEGTTGPSCGIPALISHGDVETDSTVLNETSIAEALLKTSKVIQDIDTLLSVKTSTNPSPL
ncbi:hypothetical protein GJAV_G00025300 [Gymnothorax javanicus]|nr:hypothetical protein GJAV_G00025300 [Gymnothorax javanicus]